MRGLKHLTTNRYKARQSVYLNSYQDYKKSVRSAVYGLWAGKIDLFTFWDMMQAAISRNFRRAWAEGMRECGINPNEATNQESARLQNEINVEVMYIMKFGQAVQRGSKINGGKFGAFTDRIEMWADRYKAIHDIAMTYACADEKLEWVMHPNKEHCRDCLRLNGRVYRASIWRKYAIEPRMRSLECKGYRCGCEFQKTNKPITSGRPPIIGGI